MQGFDLFVGSFEEIAHRCADGGLDDYRRRSPEDHHVAFGKAFSPSQISQLGSAVTSLTEVEEDFGNEADRREPLGCLFVDRLTPDWVLAASRLPLVMAEEVGRRWVAECIAAEGEEPPWAKEPLDEPLGRLLALCRRAASEQTDLVMVWEL